MRACFLGQNICNLGYGVAILQAPRLVMDEPARTLPEEADGHVTHGHAIFTNGVVTEALIGSRPVANPPRADA